MSLALGCTPAAAPAPPARDSVADSKLRAATRARTALVAELAAAPHDDLARCRDTAGDCLISLAENRDELVRTYYLTDCRDPEPEKQGECVTHALEQRGELEPLASYDEAENWCSRKLLECTAALASDAAHAAARQRILERRAQIEAAPKGVAAEKAPDFARERVAFVRSILPPQAQDACLAAAPAHCPDPHSAQLSQFEAELGKDAHSYDPELALGLFVAAHQAEADCNAPQLSCLIALFLQYGGTPESEKLLQQNLGLISKQQQARIPLDPEPAEECLSVSAIQYRDRIVSAYQAYAHDPVAALLLRVQKTFVSLHQAQLDCLLRLGKRSPR